MRTHRSTFSLLVILFLALVATSGAIPGFRARNAQAETKRLMGLHLNDSDNSPDAQGSWKETLVRRELDSKRRLDLVSTMRYEFNATVPTWREKWIITAGITPVVNWSTGSTTAIAAGNKDSVLAATADRLKALGAPVILRFAPGMDTGAYGSAVASPSSFKAAWIRAHDVFVARGAANVAWSWCPSVAAWTAGTALDWYPGASSVDWVCAQGANNTSTWTSFRSIFQPFYTAAGSMGKPLMIGSFGSVEKSPGMKATWIKNAYNRLADVFPNIAAAIYEDTGATALSTSATALAAWNVGVGMPALYSPTLPTLPSGKLVPAKGALLGINRLKQSTAEEQAGWNARVQQSGRNLDFAHTFYYWGQDVTSWREPWHTQNGRIMMLSWGAADTAKINTGENDAYIRASASAVKNLGVTVFIRWFYEMDGDYNANLTHSPAAFKAAWVRIHNLFDSVGATNVAWVWAPNAYGIAAGFAQAYYPGDAYVDWIAGDGFNWYPTKPGSTDVSFAVIFTGWYAWAAKQGKPLMIPVTGESEQVDPQGKANWLRDMGTAMEVLFPAVRALGYFDTVGNDAAGTGPYDRRLDTSPESIAGWAEVAQRPYFADHLAPV